MKLFHQVMLKISAASVVIIAVWAVFFYWAVIDEVDDELDDELEDYSEMLIIRVLNGEEMPSTSNGSNNQYYIYDVTEEYALAHKSMTYKDEMVYIQEKLETEPARVLITVFKTDYGYKELVVYTPTIDKNDLVQDILLYIIILYIVIVLTLLLLNIWVFRRNMKPLYILLSWFNDYKIGQGYKPLVNKSKVTEFRKLYDAVMMSVERNEKLYEQQNLFIGNASHEMQTPLAISCNRLEMVLEDDTLGEKNMEEIAKTLETLEKLSRMNKSLLMLCKIENGQYSDVTSVNLKELALQSISLYSEIFDYKNIDISTSFKSDLVVRINDSLASMLVSNLVKNAFLHSVENGMIVIDIKENKLSVSNTGVKPLDSSKVFHRFYQGSKKDNSTGLGLALCDAICKVNNLMISYEYKEGMHLFSVSKDK